jgi:glycine hydroxymethyltransferase
MGVQEMTRFGMGRDEMREIARFIARVLRGEDPATVKREVIMFRKSFLEIKYGFKLDKNIVENIFTSLNLYM